MLIGVQPTYGKKVVGELVKKLSGKSVFTFGQVLLGKKRLKEMVDWSLNLKIATKTTWIMRVHVHHLWTFKSS